MFWLLIETQHYFETLSTIAIEKEDWFFTLSEAIL